MIAVKIYNKIKEYFNKEDQLNGEDNLPVEVSLEEEQGSQTSNVKDVPVERSFDEEYEGKSWYEIWEAINEKDDDDRTYQESYFLIHDALLYDRMTGRWRAMSDLIEGQYHIKANERGNPMKEPINEALLYLSRPFNSLDDANTELGDIKAIMEGCNEERNQRLQLIDYYFPKMKNYLLLKISQLNPIFKYEPDPNTMTGEPNAWEGYMEFISFIADLYSSVYKDKTERDKEISKRFSMVGQELISIIDLNEKRQ